LPSMCEALGSIPTHKKKKKQNKASTTLIQVQEHHLC
jgi:hypothetical protein